MKWFLVSLLVLVSCSHKKNKELNPNAVREIAKEDMHLCLFVDDLKFEKDNLSEIKFHEEIRMLAASRGSNAFVIDERVYNGSKKKVIGSLLKCSAYK